MLIKPLKNYTIGDYQFYYEENKKHPRVLEKRIENNWNGKDSEKLYQIIDAFTYFQDMLDSIKINKESN